MPEGLERSGIDLVLGGFNEFLSGLGRVAQAVQRTQRSYSNAAREITNYGNKAQSVTRRVLNQEDAVAIARLRVEQATARRMLAEEKLNEAKEESATLSYNLAAAQAAEEAAVIGAQRAQRQYGDALSDANEATSTASKVMVALGVASNAVGIAFGVLGVAVQAAGTAFNLVKSAANTALSVFRGAIDTVRRLADAFWDLTRPIREFLGDVLSTAAGIGLFDVFRNAGQAIQGLISNLGEALSFFQRLDLQFEAIAARDIADRYLIPMGDAFFYAAKQAEELTVWVQNIAVTTPFSVQNLSQTLAMANAMGLNIDAAKELTTATGNFVAAMGLTEDHMFRIIYNFGQMLSQGKLNGREFRDLANSFVPVWTMMRRMADQAGVTAEEFKDLAFEGGVPVQAFFDEFIRMANEDFPGAMEKMSRTAAGVTNNIKDFIETVLGIELLGPAFDRFTGIAADALDKLLSPSVRNAAHQLGEVLLLSIDYVIERFNAFSVSVGNLAQAMGFVPPTVRGIATAISSVGVLIGRLFERLTEMFNRWAEHFRVQSTSLASNAAKFGYNVVAMFAQGMAAAVRLVVQVISYIARAISYWLSPGSPPKALPDLPKWGMNAMAEFLHGFTEADFDVLTGIQDPIREALSILEDTGKIGENMAGRLYANISKAIARAISEGSGFDRVIQQIRQVTGPFGSEIAELARRYFDLADATEAAKLAQEALEAAQKAEEDTRSAISSQVREYNRLIREGVDATQLRARLAEINATEDAARAATEQRKQAEATAETTQQQVEALKEAVNLQKQLVDQLLSITREQIIDIKMTANGKDLPLDLSDLFTIPEEPLGELTQRLEDELDEKIYRKQQMELREIFGQAEKNVDDFLAGATTAWNQFFDPFQSDLAEMKSNVDDAAGAIRQLFNPSAGPDLGDFMGGVKAQGPVPQGAFSRLEDFFRGLADAVNAVNWGQVAADFRSFTQGLAEDLGDVDWYQVGQDIGSLAEKLAELISAAKEAEQLAEDKGIGAVLINIAGGLAGKMLDAINPGMAQLNQTLTEGVIGVLQTFGPSIERTLQEQVTYPIENEFIRLDSSLITQSIIPDMMDAIQTNIIDTFTETKDDWIEMLDEIETEFTSLSDNVRVSTDNIISEFTTRLSPAFDTFTTGTLDPFMVSLGNLIQKLQNVVKWIENMTNAVNGVDVSDLGNNIPITELAGGGPVNAGQAYIVGERGWEVFVPSISGFILNQRQLAKVYQEITSRYSPVAASPVYSHVSTTSSLNVNMGGVRIYDNMSAAEFDARVRNIVREERNR